MSDSKIGDHYFAEYLGCPADSISQIEKVLPALTDATRKGNATIVGKAVHQFTPEGATAVLLLAESHISIHTWPETGLAAVDIFTCGDEMDAEIILSTLGSLLDAKQLHIKHFQRGGDSKEEYEQRKLR